MLRHRSGFLCCWVVVRSRGFARVGSSAASDVYERQFLGLVRGFAWSTMVPRAGTVSQLLVSAMIIALGNESNPLMAQTTEGLSVTDRGNIVVDDKQRTSLKKVWAGGDIVLGAATVILAMGEGRKAAASINAYLSGNEPDVED